MCRTAFVTPFVAPLSASRSALARKPALPTRTVQHRRVARMAIVSPQTARSAIAVYGVVISAGGIGAFLRSSSKPSLISGVAAGIVLAAAYVKDSLPIALGTAVALTLVFAIRLYKTNKFVPAGALALASLVAAAFFAAAIYA